MTVIELQNVLLYKKFHQNWMIFSLRYGNLMICNMAAGSLCWIFKI